MKNFVFPPWFCWVFAGKCRAFALLLLVLPGCTQPGDDEEWLVKMTIQPSSAGAALGSRTSIELVFGREIRELTLKNTGGADLVALSLSRTSDEGGRKKVDIIGLKIDKFEVKPLKVVTLSDLVVPRIEAKNPDGTVGTVNTTRLKSRFPLDGSGNLILQKDDVLALSLKKGAVTDANDNQNPESLIRRVIVE